MKFKIDENLPVEVKERLAAHGHDAHTVHEEELIGSQDSVIYQVAQGEDRIIITLDLDFSDIRTYVPSESKGIIVLRMAMQDKDSILQIMDRVILLLSSEKIVGRLWIVGGERVRIRD
ncbi:MAG: DUF5615 family PIN-like protein [Verrucomicrobiae bacterium]